jgi:hypothetical protein
MLLVRRGGQEIGGSPLPVFTGTSFAGMTAEGERLRDLGFLEFLGRGRYRT